MDDELLAEHVDAIHGVPLDTFVSARDARVRQLRSDGHREEAAALGRHRKPTVAAWAVNQLPRRHPTAVADLVDAGRELHAAQLRATSGRGADGLRTATRRLRELARDLTAHAAAILDEAGSAPHDAEVEQTLFATATDPELHEDLQRGVLERPVEVSGFGPMAALAVVPDDATSEPDASGPDEDADEEDTDADADAEAARAREEAARQARRRELEDERADLERARVRQQRRVERQASRAEELQARLDDLQAELSEVRASAETARDELRSLDEELARVEAAVEELDASAS